MNARAVSDKVECRTPLGLRKLDVGFEGEDTSTFIASKSIISADDDDIHDRLVIVIIFV